MTSCCESPRVLSLQSKWLRFLRVGIIALSGAGACTKANPVSCLDGHCSDPELPFCDVDGTLSGTAGTCVAVSCTPGEFLGCREDQAVACASTGENYDLLQCAYGCSAESHGCHACVGTPAECGARIVPRYVPQACAVASTSGPLTITTSSSLDTSNDTACTGGVVTQTTGPNICVVRADTITVERNRTLTVRGTRALALVADGQLLIDGILDVSADLGVNGPGGGFLKSGSTSVPPAGSGGAGFKTAGASGGNSTTNGGAANGGSAAMDPALLEEIVGGTTSVMSTLSETAGGGGGAVTLISCQGLVSIVGTIDAGGGGGSGGLPDIVHGFAVPAGGGGSGGNVVLQGFAVSVTGELFANGGGGGAGLYFGGGAAGDDGPKSATSGARGGIAVNGAGTGGAGGFVGNPPEVGIRSTDPSPASAGAGGGSTGFIQTYTPIGVTPLLTPTAVSPAFQVNRAITTR